MRNRLAHQRDIAAHRGHVTRDGSADVDHHVDLRRTRGNRQRGLAGLDPAVVLTGREPATAASCSSSGHRSAAPDTIDGDTHTAYTPSSTASATSAATSAAVASGLSSV
jgi:hypothetical protein